MAECYTLAVPTTRPRHLITETEPIALALDDAARRWPEDSDRRARLLVRLALEGHRAIVVGTDQADEVRRADIRRTSGAMDGVYGPAYLDELRAEWPR